MSVVHAQRPAFPKGTKWCRTFNRRARGAIRVTQSLHEVTCKACRRLIAGSEVAR